MTDTPGTLDERLRAKVWTTNRAGSLLPSHEPPSINIEAADEITSLRARVEVMREALEAISVSGIHRDTKWFGMRAHDIARQTLKDTPVE